MEAVVDHVIEPGAALPPPRPARPTPGTLLLLAMALLLFGLFLYGGARALIEAVQLGWFAAEGRTLPAKITQVEMLPLKGQPALPTRLHYVYYPPSPPDAPERTGEMRVGLPSLDNLPQGNSRSAASPPVAAPTFHVGGTLPLRWALWRGQPVTRIWLGNPVGKIGFLVFCGSLLVAVSVLLTRRLLVWQGQRLRLCRLGVATIGTIIHKHAQTDDGVHYFIRYGYARDHSPLAPVLCEREEQVTNEQWKRLEIGQPVTVLYDPAQPEAAGLYTILQGK